MLIASNFSIDKNEKREKKERKRNSDSFLYVFSIFLFVCWRMCRAVCADLSHGSRPDLIECTSQLFFETSFGNLGILLKTKNSGMNFCEN